MFFYWGLFYEFLEMVWYTDLGDFWAYPLEILVFASPTRDMSTSSSLPSVIWVIFCRFSANFCVIILQS